MPRARAVMGLGAAKIGPTVAAGAGGGDFKTVRGDSLGSDVVGGGAVDGDHGGEARTIRRCRIRQRMPRRLPSAFLADVAGESDGFVGAHAAFVERRASDADERGESCTVIGDAGANETIAIFLDAHVGAGGENGVEMRGEQDDAPGVRAGRPGDHVSGFVDTDFQAEARGSRIFLEIGGGGPASVNSGAGISAQCDSPLGDPGGVFVDPGRGLSAGRIVRDFLDGVGGGARRNGGHHKHDTAEVEEFHGFLGFDFSAECGAARVPTLPDSPVQELKPYFLWR